MSNSLPRTMRRNAAMRGSTSSNSNAKVRGLTVPSLSAWLLPWLRVTVLSLSSVMTVSRVLLSGVVPTLGCRPRESGDDIAATSVTPSWKSNQASLHRRLGHAGTRGERLFGGVLERLIRRQHHRGRAHLVVRRIDAGRRDTLLRQRLRLAQQAMTRHDDPVVGGNEVLFGAVADRSHALLQRGILDGEAGNAAEGLAGLLRRAVNQIVVVLVGERPIGARGVLAVHARAVAHGVNLAPGERAYRMKVVAPGPAILVVDRDPEVAVDRVIAARRDHGEAGHYPGRDTPVVIAVLGVTPGADIKPARLLDHLEIRLHVGEVVFVALGALEQRIGAEVAAVQEGDVAGIDSALHRLQPVAFLQALGDEGLTGRHRREFPFRQRRLLLRRAHIGPQHRPALHQRV